MEEVGAQVASPMFIHGALSNRFCESPLMARKRSYPSFITQPHHFHHQDLQHQPDPRSNWSSSSWNWDSSAFVAKHVEPGVLQLGTAAVEQRRREEGRNGSHEMLKKSSGDGVDENLRLNLGGPIGTKPVDEPRPNKRVRSGSPGSNYPMCQVDECSEDLSTAKDYHRRHKVCEFHSKSAKALVGKQMQRFCQQCSRFHLLSEFDEGKRSCRRRLAGHNRRRRKTSQADDANSRPVNSSSQENTSINGNPDIISLLSAFARTQGKNVDSGALPDKDQILQILSKINSLALPVDLANKLAAYQNLNGAVSGQASSGQTKPNGTMPSPSTMDLLTALSATTLTQPNPETLAILSQKSRAPMEFNSVGGERSSSSYQSPIEDSDCHVQETRMPNLPLQLFSSSPENDSSPPTLASSRKYFSSDSSNPTEERSPSSSPVVQRLFPIQSSASAMNSEISMCRETNRNVESNRTKAVPLELFRDHDRRPEHGPYQSHGLYQSSPYQTGYTSSSGSDHSPSSLSLDTQDRTCRIMFKLFDKDPSHLPGGLRSQIHNWLSNSPMEMESYIRPGCVVLSIYLSMPSATWDQLEGKFAERIRALVDSEPDFWGTGRFLIHTGRKLASHDSGKINLCKSWRICSPELISVSPLAVVGGQSTSIQLKGRNLISPRTKIHYTNMGGYISKVVTEQNSHNSIHDEIRITNFQVDGLAPANLGRCFIEVEDGFKGHSFPVIIADSTICNELRVLESELEENDEKRHGYGTQQPNSRQQVLHFLNELGWLFQGLNRSPTEQHDPNHILRRYKFLFTFAVERDWCCLVKKLLDILMKTHFEGAGLSRESLEELSEVQLLNRAVRRQCRKMVDLLIQYEISGFSDGSSKEYIFPPNLAGPGGVTPLHLAASTSGSDDIVDALTNDPQQIGLNCWRTLLDATGQSPHAYAAMRNNHSYNDLVDQKLADRKNGQVSVRLTIGSEIGQDTMSHRRAPREPCTKCAAVSAKYGTGRRIPGRQGVLHRPYIHSMLVIGAVCVCVCLFLRGAPKVGLIAPFKWENLDFGAI